MASLADRCRQTSTSKASPFVLLPPEPSWFALSTLPSPNDIALVLVGRTAAGVAVADAIAVGRGHIDGNGAVVVDAVERGAAVFTTADVVEIFASATKSALLEMMASVAATAVAGLAATLGTAATRNVGTTAGTVAAGNDSRLADARTPTAHAASHAQGAADALPILTRGPGDMWIQLTCSGTPTTAGQEVSVQALGSGSSGPEASPLPGDSIGFGAWSMRSNASSNNSGYSYRSTAAAEAVPARGGLFARTRAAIRTTSSSMRSILAAFFNGAATSGFGWIFFGDQAQARVGNGTVTQTAPFTLAVDTFYVFETEVAPDFLSATFRIYDGNAETLLFSETITANFPAVGLGLTIFFAQGIFITTPGAITNTVSVSHMGAGTRRGYDVWRRGVA